MAYNFAKKFIKNKPELIDIDTMDFNKFDYEELEKLRVIFSGDSFDGCDGKYVYRLLFGTANGPPVYKILEVLPWYYKRELVNLIEGVLENA